MSELKLWSSRVVALKNWHWQNLRIVLVQCTLY